LPLSNLGILALKGGTKVRLSSTTADVKVSKKFIQEDVL